jgi:N-acetylglucosaminyldiphosphoundecaprenol N-acetyl-beta-D-mannosaminyltransferase
VAELTRVELMGCPCFAVSEDTLEQQLMHFVDDNICGYSVAINAEKIQKYKKDQQLKEVIDGSIYPYPDGAGAVLGIKWLYKQSSEKINMPIRVLEIANRNKLKVFIIGAKEAVHNKGVAIIKARYPNIELVGNMHGYHSEDEIIAKVSQTKPQIIMLAMGSPRQEIFANKLIKQCQYGFAVGCGGALDILAGELKRAPEFYINNNLEWLYRLVQEPWRWKRQLFLPVFFTKLMMLRISSKIFKSKRLDLRE